MSIENAAAELLPRARAGDADALAALLRLHTQALQADLRRQLPERWRSLLAVEDVLQETFTDAFLAIGGFVSRGDDALLIWLKRLARNNMIEAIRGLEAEKRGGSVRRVDFGDGPDPRTSLLRRVLSRTQVTPSQQLVRREASELLDRGLAALPAHYRLAIQRYDLDGLSIQAVAAELGCSPGGLHLIRHRAFQRLRSVMAGNSQQA